MDVGYYDGRTLKFITSNSLLEWPRLPGDLLLIVAGAVPVLWIALRGVRHGRPHDQIVVEADMQLFTEVEVHEPAEATAAQSLR